MAFSSSIISWAQAIWAAVVLWRPSRLWLWLGIAGNAIILAVYLASRTTGLPFGPDVGHPEAGRRPGRGERHPGARPDRRVRGAAVAALARRPAGPPPRPASRPSPAWRPSPPRDRGDHGGDDARLGRSRRARGHGVMASSRRRPGAGRAARHGRHGHDRGLPDMKMYGSTAPPTAAQVIAAGQLIKADRREPRPVPERPGRVRGRVHLRPAAPTARSTCSTTAPTPPTPASTRSTRPPWSTRSTCRTTRRSCSAPCTSRTRTPTGRRSAAC